MKKKHTIMTIDDEDSIRMLIESVLTQNGYRALAADSGAKGLELAQGESVDLILLDVNMPEMNGREVVQRLRANPDTRTIPVIMLTGNNSAKDKVQGLNAGADEYVTKPVSGTELVARIRALLRMKELQDDVLQLEREKHLAQLTLAKSIQQSLIPQELPQIPGLDLAVRYQSCDIIGGDFYDFFTDGERTCLILGDAEGHGIGAALLMARAGAYVRASLRSDQFSPAHIITAVNKFTCEDHSSEALLPLICISIDLQERVLRYCNGGHLSPLFYHTQQQKFVALNSTGAILGTDPTQYYDEVRMPLEESNILLCFTDGLVEAVDADGAAFDEKRAESLVQQNSDGSAEALTESILSAWTSHTDGKVEDDLTLIAARF